MEKMKLGGFIAQTLIEIIDGVSVAQAYAKENNASINPQHVKWSDTKKSFYVSDSIDKDEAPLLSPIEFEILLTIGEDDKAQGGLGIFAASLGIGIKGEAKEYSETANRIKFQILAKLPQQR
ncbi:MAG: hypothetical protein HY865_15210 [Chloroflexi bacterium]|nr:hypothetical protein [Chloroflexota bacterium]